MDVPNSKIASYYPAICLWGFIGDGFVIWSSEPWKLEDSEVSSGCRWKTNPKREEITIHPWCNMGPQSTVLFSILYVSDCLSKQVQPGSGSSEPSTGRSLLWCCVGVGVTPTLTALFASTAKRKSWLASKLCTHWKDRWRERNGVLQMSFTGAKTKPFQLMATPLKEILKKS